MPSLCTKSFCALCTQASISSTVMLVSLHLQSTLVPSSYHLAVRCSVPCFDSVLNSVMQQGRCVPELPAYTPNSFQVIGPQRYPGQGKAADKQKRGKQLRGQGLEKVGHGKRKREQTTRSWTRHDKVGRKCDPPSFTDVAHFFFSRNKTGDCLGNDSKAEVHSKDVIWSLCNAWP